MDFKYLDWDSKFLGFQVGRIDCQLTDQNKEIPFNSSKFNCCKLLYIFSSYPININELNLKLVDHKIVYSREIVGENISSKHVTEFPVYKLSDGTVIPKELYDLAYVSGEYSRFRTDSNFGESTFKRMYAKWLENSLRHEIADAVYVFKQSPTATPIGMITIKQNNDVATIGLLAVDPSSQRLGVGHELIKSAEMFCLLRGIKFLQVTTQEDNIKACTFYEKEGFTKYSRTYIYHRWL